MSQAQHDRRIDYIEINVTDVARAKQFYTDAFGWKWEDYGPDYQSFHDGRMAGGLRGVKPSEHRPGGSLIVIYAVDLSTAQRKVEQAGGTIVRQPYEFPGGRRFHFTDPSGNELAVWTDQ